MTPLSERLIAVLVVATVVGSSTLRAAPPVGDPAESADAKSGGLNVGGTATGGLVFHDDYHTFKALLTNAVEIDFDEIDVPSGTVPLGGTYDRLGVKFAPLTSVYEHSLAFSEPNVVVPKPSSPWGDPIIADFDQPVEAVGGLDCGTAGMGMKVYNSGGALLGNFVLDPDATTPHLGFGGVIADSPIISRVEFYSFAGPGAVFLDNLIWQTLGGPSSGTFVVVGDTEGMMRVFDAEFGALLWQDDVGLAIRGLDISANDEYIVVGSAGGLAVYEADGDLVGAVGFGVSGGTSFIPDNHPVAISADGSLVVAATSSPPDGVVLCTNDGGGLTCPFLDSLPDARSVDIAADGSAIIAGGSSVRYYDESLAPVFTDPFNARIVSISDDGESAIAGATFGGQARVYTRAGPAVQLTTPPSIVTAAISADGTLVATGNDDPADSAGAVLSIYDDGGDGWDTSDGLAFCVFDGTHQGGADIRSIAFSADGGSVAVGGASVFARTRVFGVEDGECRRDLQSALANETLSLALSFDGSLIASCGRKKVWINRGNGLVQADVLLTLPGAGGQPPAFNAVAISSGLSK